MRGGGALPLAAPILAATGATAEDRPPPLPGDADDFVRWVFETHACVMTEERLLTA